MALFFGPIPAFRFALAMGEVVQRTGRLFCHFSGIIFGADCRSAMLVGE
jgi:hypothetical protein